MIIWENKARKWNMKTKDTFHLCFKGEALNDGSIDINDLAPALLALRDIFYGVKSSLTKNKQEMNLRVRADFQRSSFITTLEFVIIPFMTLLSGDYANTMATFFTITGINGVGLLQYYKKLKGKTPKEVLPGESPDELNIKVEGDNNTIVVNKDIENISKQPFVQKGFNKLINSVNTKGIDSLSIQYKDETTFSINKEEANEIKNNRIKSELDNSKTKEKSITETFLQIKKLSFIDNKKWKVTSGNNDFEVSIDDEEFMDNVISGKESFSSGDVLQVQLSQEQFMQNGQLKSNYSIIKVIEHTKQKNSLF